MKNNLLIVLLMTFSLQIMAQEEVLLSEKDGVRVSYQLYTEEEGKKKDSYLVIVNAVNNSDTHLYYEVPLIEVSPGNMTLPLFPEDKGFTKIEVRNSTGLFGNGQSIIGKETDLITTGNAMLFIIEKGEILTDETSFKVKAGNQPLITNSFSKTLGTLDSFDLKIDPQALNGDYLSSCGEIKVNLLAQSSPERGDFLVQTTNGSQFIWIRTSETTFVRENFGEMSLSFNKETNTFSYSTADGINCSWTRS